MAIPATTCYDDNGSKLYFGEFGNSKSSYNKKVEQNNIVTFNPDITAFDKKPNCNLSHSDISSKTIYNRDTNYENNNVTGGGSMDIDIRLGKVEVRLDNVENRLDRIDGKLDRFESRFDNIENILSRNTAFLEANLEWLKESSKEMKVELNNSKRHTQIMVYTSYALVLAAAIGIGGIWFTTWSTNNQILSTLMQLVQTISQK